MLTISSLYIYPIKSLGGIAVSSAELTDRGFKYDRRWMLVDENNRFITQREWHQLSLLETTLLEDGILVRHKTNQQEMLIPFEPQTDIFEKARIWDDDCLAQFVSPAADEWFSNLLGIVCRLVYMPDQSERSVDPKYAKEGELTAFSDGYPLLLIGEASLADLNSRLAEPVGMERFRPNIVFSGGQPYQEDEIGEFTINNIGFAGVKPCPRCVVTTIDPETGNTGKEPLKTLATYRQRNKKVMFGEDLLYSGIGTISVGDEIVLKRT